MMTARELAARADVERAFPGCLVDCWHDRPGYVARIDLTSGSWCSTRGRTAGTAIRNCLKLAREPAPGFPGWVEPRRVPADEDVVILS